MANSGLQGMNRLPRDTVRARRNATQLASNFTSLLGDGLTMSGAGLITIDLAANPGLAFSGGDLTAKVAAPIALDATGIHLDYNTNYFALSGVNLSIVNPVTADIVSSNDITAANFTTAGLGTFGNLDVDTLNLNGNVISDSTGTISFNNENLITTGKIYLRDTAIGIYSQVDTFLDIFADGSVRIGDSVAGAPTNYTEMKADGEINLHGTARVIRHLRVGAASWDRGAAAPTAGFEGVFSTLDFDAALDDEAHYTIIVPHRRDSTVDVEFAIDWFYDGGQDNGTVCWALEYKAIKAGEVVTGAGTTITKVSAGTHTTGQMVRTTFITKILAANLEAGDTLGLRLYRDVSADTLATDARLINTHFHFTMDKLGQAT